MNLVFVNNKNSRETDPMSYSAQQPRKRRKHKSKKKSNHQSLAALKQWGAFHTCYTLPKRALYPLVLDPLPSSHIHSCTLANDTLVTSHRQGIRLYTTARVKAAANAHASGSGGNSSSGGALDALTDLWWLRESRTDYDFKDTYLCSGAEPVFLDSEQLLLPHSRYFAVASGNDRSPHSVCVISAAAHFNLHHTLHQSNKIVCLKLAHIALDPMKERQLTPVVVSIDELGCVALFNVERNNAVPLLAWPDTAVGTAAPASTARPATTERIEASVLSKLTSLAQRQDASRYQLQDGLATNVALVGPCVQACPHCNNAFSDNALGKKALAPFTAMSLFIAARGNDTVGDAPSACGSAELRVTYIRLLWGAQGAVVLREHRVVDETASHDVCDAGPVLYATPHRVGKPLTVLVSRPGLRLEIRRGCTGEAIGMLELQSNPNRSSMEYILQWAPLGRHRLLASEASEAVFCYAARTDNMTILLVSLVAAVDGATGTDEAKPPQEAEEAEEDRQALELWLNDDATTSSTAKFRTALRRPKAAAPLQLSVLYELFSPAHYDTSSTTCVEGDISFFFHPAQNALLLFAKQEENFFRLPLPFREVLSTTESSVGPLAPVIPLRATEEEKDRATRAAAAAAAAASPVNRVEDTLWDATKRLTNMWTPSSTSWGGYFGGVRGASGSSGGGGDGAVVAARASTQQNGSPSSSSLSRYDLNLARPLMNAMLQWSGGEGGRPSMTVHEVPAAHSTPRGAAGDAPPPLGAPPSPSNAQRAPSPSPRPHADAGGSEREPDVERDYVVTEETISLGAFRPHRESSTKRRQSFGTPRRHHRDHQAQLEADAYLKSQVEAHTQGPRGSVLQEAATPTTTAWEDRLRRLETVEEPLARNGICYTWCDGYNDLFFALAEQMEALAEARESQQARRHIREAVERRLFGRHALHDLRQGRLPPRFATAVEEVTEGRRRTNNKRGLFDFASYFASGGRPPHLVDLQERDKCLYELADLRIKQEREIAALPLYDTAKVYQNEEASGPPAHRHWRAHNTFPFDDEGGNTVDMGFYNNSADRCTKGVWEWAPTSDGEALSPDGSPTGKRTFLVAKELKDWVAGPWMYATRWPSVQEIQSDSFKWQTEESKASVVRTRALTRRRVNVKAKKMKEEMEKKHFEALQNLRAELGL